MRFDITPPFLSLIGAALTNTGIAGAADSSYSSVVGLADISYTPSLRCTVTSAT